MFIVIVTFPPISSEKEEEFLEWFAWSNKEFRKCNGFIGRRLLKPLGGGNYTAIVEHESHETFVAMQNSTEHRKAGKRAAPLFDGHPTPQFFEVIME